MRAVKGTAEKFGWRMLWLSLLLVALPGMGTDMFFSSLGIIIHVNLSIFFGKHLLSVPSSQNWKAFPFLSALPKVDSNPFHVLSLSEILKEISKTFPTTKFFGKKK